MSTPSSSLDRRTFIQGAGTLAAASLSAAPSLAAAQESAAGDAELRVALIGCGGRGTSACGQALNTGNTRLVAMADAFSDRMEESLSNISAAHPDAVDVPEERKFVGFDAFKKAIDEDVDVVILTTPPGFRPEHFDYAVSKGKHIFMEKPVAVDGPGIRTVMEAAAVAKEKKLCVGVGLQRHHSFKYQDTVRAIEDGAIGKPVALRVYWNSGGVWVKPRKPQWNEMQYQMRNWYYFNWLCGDHIVEQHIHNIDVCNWVKGGPPVKAQGVGGRQVRTGVEFGEIFDHHMVEFTYADGTKLLSECRHQKNTWGSVSEHAHGTKGTATFSRYSIETEGEKWRYREEVKNPYQVEHDRLFSAIRSGAEHNEAEYGATSTMTSILGRMATYSGKEVDMEKALASETDLMPERLAWDAAPKVLPLADGSYPIPTPGVSEPY